MRCITRTIRIMGCVPRGVVGGTFEAAEGALPSRQCRYQRVTDGGVLDARLIGYLYLRRMPGYGHIISGALRIETAVLWLRHCIGSDRGVVVLAGVSEYRAGRWCFQPRSGCFVRLPNYSQHSSNNHV